MTSRSFSTSGIIIRLAELGESDRFVTVYTEEYGKITCIAKGIRSVKSRRSPHIELMNRVKLQLWRSRHHVYMTQASTEARFSDLKKDIVSVASGAFMIEAMERLTPDEESHPELYRLLDSTLSLMNFYPEQHQLLRETYLIKLLQTLGNITSFHSCSDCKKRLPYQDAFLDREHSTINCHDCTQEKSDFTFELIPLDTLKLMNFILEHPLDAILKLKTDLTHLQTMSEFGRTFLYKMLPRGLKSEQSLNLY